MRKLLTSAALVIAAPLLVAAENTQPTPLAIVDTIPAARDIAYPGTIQLEVDASDTRQGIMRVRQTIPVASAGRLTLLLPEWLPGHHGPDGQLDKIAGLEFFANGQKLRWFRDPVEVYAYQVAVPAGATAIEARFAFVSPTQPNQGRIVVTPDIINVQWESVSLYPAGYYTRRIPVVATLTIPAGWQAATALRPSAPTRGNRITYGEVNYETLVDSPVMAARYLRKDDLGNGVTLNSLAADEKELKIPADVLAKHRKMVDQTIKTFGARHFDHYDFLNVVNEDLGGIGLEHHRSTEITTDLGYYTDYTNHLLDRNVFPHELVHSWNGKYRRPADQIVPDYRTPLRNGLLWVYEGQTQFWGTIIEARSGMSSKQDVLDMMARSAAALDNQRGRLWRPLVDTTNDPIIQNRRPEPWGSFQRNEDYYSEGMLIWTEADAIIRQGTGNRRGIDDFARAFFGVRDGDWGVLPYTREEVIRTLNAVYPYDWASFLHDRVDVPTERAPLGGFTRSGYELHYTEEPTPASIARAKLGEYDDFIYSLGFNVSKGRITTVQWGSPAFDAKLKIGDEIIAVADRTYSGERLKTAVTDAKKGRPIHLTVKSGDHIRPIQINYTGGLRYPRFVKVGKGKGPLDLLLEPR